jgi:hypothetical protein
MGSGHAFSLPWTTLGGWRLERAAEGNWRREDDNNLAREEEVERTARGLAVPASWGAFPAVGDATVGTRETAQFGFGFGGGSRDGGRHLSRMFNWNDEQPQVPLPVCLSRDSLESCVMLAHLVGSARALYFVASFRAPRALIH